MSRNSIRQGVGILAIRVVIWLLALVATAGAVLSIDSVLRNRSAENDAGSPPVILPPPAGEARSAPNAVETATRTAAKTVAALAGIAGPGNDFGRDGVRRDNASRDAAGSQAGVPAFDVARVEPSGDTVIAGRATPGATVELLRNGRVHDRVVADASGQFAMVPPKLPAGDSELTLRSSPPGGAPATSSKQTVVVAVQANLKDQPVVALMTPDQPSVVLSKPAAPDASTGSIVVETVEAEAGGRKLFVTGHSAPGALVRLYLNDSYHSTATADGSGRVAFVATNDDALRGGDYRVRLDEVDRASGVIKSRAEVPFMTQKVATAAVPEINEVRAGAGASRTAAASAGVAGEGAPGPGSPAATEQAPKGKVMTVSRGDSLWRISRLAYGDGARYTVIYDANHKQIRNPNRIYPGQIFLIPGGNRKR